MFTIKENDELLKEQRDLYKKLLNSEVTVEVAAEANNTVGKIIGLQRNQLLLQEMLSGLPKHNRNEETSVNHRR